MVHPLITYELDASFCTIPIRELHPGCNWFHIIKGKDSEGCVQFIWSCLARNETLALLVCLIWSRFVLSRDFPSHWVYRHESVSKNSSGAVANPSPFLRVTRCRFFWSICPSPHESRISSLFANSLCCFSNQCIPELSTWSKLRQHVYCQYFTKLASLMIQLIVGPYFSQNMLFEFIIAFQYPHRTLAYTDCTRKR